MILTAIVLMSCSGGNMNEVLDIEMAQARIFQMQNGIFEVTTEYLTESEVSSSKTDFQFILTNDGVYEYTSTNFDNSNKKVFVEVMNAQNSQQWLLGRGWEEIEYIAYDKDNPHPYFQLLTYPLDNIANVTITEDVDCTIYVLEIDAQAYQEQGLISRTVTYVIDANGDIESFTDCSEMQENGVVVTYTAHIAIIKEILRPDDDTSGSIEEQKEYNGEAQEPTANDKSDGEQVDTEQTDEQPSEQEQSEDVDGGSE